MFQGGKQVFLQMNQRGSQIFFAELADLAKDSTQVACIAVSQFGYLSFPPNVITLKGLEPASQPALV